MVSQTELAILISAKDAATGTLNKISASANGLGGKLKLLAGAAAGAAAGFISFKAAESAINATQQLGLSVAKMARETGLSTEASSRLLFAFHHVGLNADDASRSIGIFAKKLKGVSDEETGVTSGGKSMAQILADVGVSATDAAGNIRPIDEILGPLADKFKAMPDGLEKTGLAMQLFGRSGKDMIPLLNLGSEGMSELAKTADKLGVTLSADNIAKIKAYTFAHRDMEEAIAGVKLQIGLALMPALTQLAEFFTAHQPEIREFVQEGIVKMQTAIGAAAPVIRNFSSDVRDLGNWLIDHKEAMVGTIVALGVAFAWTNPLGVVVLGIGAIIAAVELLRTKNEELSEPMLELKLRMLGFAHSALEAAFALAGLTDKLHITKGAQAEVNDQIRGLEREMSDATAKLFTMQTGLDSATAATLRADLQIAGIARDIQLAGGNADGSAAAFYRLRDAVIAVANSQGVLAAQALAFQAPALPPVEYGPAVGPLPPGTVRPPSSESRQTQSVRHVSINVEHLHVEGDPVQALTALGASY